jgi:transposase
LKFLGWKCCERQSLSDACELLSLSWDQAHRIMERAVARGLERRCLEELDAVGIDEKSFLRGQSYLSVLSDPKCSRVLEVTEGRERASAERLFESLALEQRQKVEAVVMDMSAAFEAAAEAQMPQAEIVHDRFHVSKHLNEAVDKVRRIEHRELKEQGEETLKGSKFLFLFAPENLDRAPRPTARPAQERSESRASLDAQRTISPFLGTCQCADRSELFRGVVCTCRALSAQADDRSGQDA